MELKPCDGLPNWRKPPKFTQWVPLVEEFLASGERCSMVEPSLSTNDMQLLRVCIRKRYPGQVKAHVIGGESYLTREGAADE